LERKIHSACIVERVNSKGVKGVEAEFVKVEELIQANLQDMP